MAGKQELYLHIGTVKTGTTALQRFFALNRQTLQRHDISYPESKGQHDAHHRFSWSLALAAGKSPSLNWPDNLGPPRDEWNFLRKQCDSQKILLSSERFARSSPQSILTMKKFFSQYKIKIIVYWRRCDILENSWYNQRIKGGGRTAHFSCRPNHTRKKHLDSWAAIFGRENILLRPYEKGQLHQDDVLADFMHHVFGLELDEGFRLPEKKVNEGLHRVVLEYKRNLNHLNLSWKEKRKTVHALKAASTVFDREGRKNFPVISPRKRLELIQRYAGENADIAREYLGRKNGILFFDPLPNPDDEWEPYECLCEADSRKINRYLARHYPDVFDIIVQGILMSLGYGPKIHESAQKLLPGIVPGSFNKILEKTLEMPCDYAAKVFKEELHNLHESRTWRVGMFLRSLYARLPSGLQKPVLEAAQFVYQKRKWT